MVPDQLGVNPLFPKLKEMKMKKLLLLPLLLAFSAPAFAVCPDPIPLETVCISWQAPTQNEDGSTIPDTGPGSIASYQVLWAFTPGNFDPASRIINVNDPTVRDITTLGGTINIQRPPGGGDVDIFFVMTATNTEGEVSQISNQVAKVVSFSAPVPGTPTILDVLINITTS